MGTWDESGRRNGPTWPRPGVFRDGVRAELCAEQEHFLNPARHTMFPKLPRQELQEMCPQAAALRTPGAVVVVAAGMELSVVPAVWVAAAG